MAARQPNRPQQATTAASWRHMLVWLLAGLSCANCSDLDDAWAQVIGAVTSNVLSLGYATHAFEGFCISAFAELYHGMQPVILGYGREPGAGLVKLRQFREINIDKFKETRAFVEWLAETADKHRAEPPLVYAHDSGDSLQLRDASCIAEGHAHKGRPILWAAERTFYVGWEGSREHSSFSWLEQFYPELPTGGLQENGARYLNGGAYVGRVQALIEMFSEVLDLKSTLDMKGNVLAHEGYLYFEHNGTRHVSEATRSNDQALSSFYYIKNLERYGGQEPIVLDHESRTFECMHQRMEGKDYSIADDGTFSNTHTESRPCMLHFNGPKGAKVFQRVFSECKLLSEEGLANVLKGKVLLWRPNVTDAGLVHQVSYAELCPSYNVPGVPHEFLQRIKQASGISSSEL